MQSRKLWNGSHGTILPPVAPTSKRPEGRPSAGLQRVQPPGLSKPRGKHNLLESEPLVSSGRRRSVSFDEVYLQNALAASQGQFNRSSGGVSRLRADTNLSRRMRSGSISSIKEWDSWSDGGPAPSHKKPLFLPGISSHRDLIGEVRIRHPVMSRNKRSTYPAYRTDASSSLNSSSWDNYFGQNSRGRQCHQSSEEKGVKYEKTYRMEPRTNFHRAEGSIRTMMEDYLENTLNDLSADSSTTATEAARAANRLAESIKHQVKLERLERYKVISLATICLKSGQDLVSSSRCVWDTQTDGFISVTKQNKGWFGEVTVYAVYQE
eukprot:XP_011684268.1 PREDICTED: uncharacterized protein LOC105447631 [Strongylocentrotus purpuratus]